MSAQRNVRRSQQVKNPYRPGAGHAPPYLAGRGFEQAEFRRLLAQDTITENVLITGLRGMGKTVLLETFAGLARDTRWLWVGNDLSESAGLSEERLGVRILTDIARVLAEHRTGSGEAQLVGFVPTGPLEPPPSYDQLCAVFLKAPGLPSDKLRAAIDIAMRYVATTDLKGIVLAYDEAQCLADHADRHEYPLSMLLETCIHLQKRYPDQGFMLVLTGLPTLLDSLTMSRTYSERMFNVMALDRLARSDTLAAIREPLDLLALDVPGSAVDKIVELSVGYPYLIQFFAKEMVDAVLHAGAGALEGFPSEAVWRRLDSGIFAARWGRTTDKQREALKVMARLPAETAEFTPHDVADGSAEFGIGAMTNAQAGQIMQGLVERGLIYRTRRGKYAFALPMSRVMILRRMLDDDDQGLPGFADLSAPAEIVAHQPASDELEIEERPGPAIYASGAAVDDSEPAPMSDELVAAFREVMRTVPVRPQREVLRGSPRADASAMAAPAASSFWSFRGMRS